MKGVYLWRRAGEHDLAALDIDGGHCTFLYMYLYLYLHFYFLCGGGQESMIRIDIYGSMDAHSERP